MWCMLGNLQPVPAEALHPIRFGEGIVCCGMEVLCDVA